MTNFLWYLAWVLLPLVPALLLFMVLPKSGKAWLKGLFHGMEIKLSGSVAVYFLLFYTMNPVKLNLIDVSSFQNGWEMKATFTDPEGKPIPVSQLERIEALPETQWVFTNGKTINLYLPVLQVLNDQTVKLPHKYQFVFKDYEPTIIESVGYFDNKKICKVLSEDRVICLENMPTLVAKKKDPVDSSSFIPAKEIAFNP